MRPNRSTRRFSFRVLAASGALLALALLSPVRAAAEPGVLIALDSSRSLSAEESRAAAVLARDLIAGLTATPAGVVTFDDSVHWLARPGEAGAEAALDAVRPTGRHTVLHDALIEGVRELPDGGVLVLISDGKDEESATTIEDVARLASEQKVRVVTLAAGRADERTLRRLALLTGGVYAGAAKGADPNALRSDIQALRDRVAAEATPPPAAAPPPAPAPASNAPPPVVERAARESSRPLLLIGALVAAAGIVIGFLLARRRAAAEAIPEYDPDAGTKPGVVAPSPSPAPAPLPASEPEQIDAAQLERLRSRAAVPPNGLMEVSLDDTAAFQRLPFSEAIERTLVLTEEVVLKVREPGHEARTFRVPPGRAIDVGRDAKRNTLSFPDPTMSVQHFRLVLDDGEVFLLDLGSTNGVLHHERRVASARIEPGDRFRAGMFEFELLLHRASVA